jgi:EAL domain-containing protein (putative c-di-GMP-specific phosphodiesterase class I)
MAEAPPDYLKFERWFVTGIESAPASRRHLVASLVGVAHDLKVKSVAQGVETAEEARTCRRLGFSHAQGFIFGKPKPIDEL